jgi:F420-0:gamma-glutamyl ligase-like protein
MFVFLIYAMFAIMFYRSIYLDSKNKHIEDGEHTVLSNKKEIYTKSKNITDYRKFEDKVQSYLCYNYQNYQK